MDRIKIQDGNLIEKTDAVKFNIYGQKQTIANRHVDDSKYIPEEYKNFAKGMEKQFAEMMIEQMNDSVLKDEESEGNSATKYYESIMNSERADIMTTKDGGLGVQKMILEQLYPKSKRNQLTYNGYLAQKNIQQSARGDKNE